MPLIQNQFVSAVPIEIRKERGIALGVAALFIRDLISVFCLIVFQN